MTILPLMILIALPLTIFAKEKSEFPQDGYIIESVDPIAPGTPDSQFDSQVYRGAKVQTLAKMSLDKKESFRPGDYFKVTCGQAECWIKQEFFLPVAAAERAAVLKNDIDNFENPKSKKPKGKSSLKEGSLVFVTKKENGFCEALLNSKTKEWISCSNLAFDNSSVDAALDLEKIKIYLQHPNHYKDALQIALQMKDEPKKPFSSLGSSQEKDIRDKIAAAKKDEADPDDQPCSEEVPNP